MPGLIPHIIAGCTLYFIGRYSFKNYFKGDQKLKKELFLAIVCLTFSLIPDLFLGFYYLIHLESEAILMPYQVFTHMIITPLVFMIMISISLFDRKRRPFWINGASALILHIIMDLLIQETNYLI